MIEMIIEGRSPTMRHVSRTHRVAWDWLFDKINLEFKIQILYYIDTKHQIAYIFTISHVTNGVIFFIFATSAISTPVAALRISAL